MRQRLGIAGRAAGRPAGADVRRAGQRAGPGGHPLDARAAPRPRGARRHGAAVLAPARRGRAHGRPAAGDRGRADRRRRAGGLAAGFRRCLRALHRPRGAGVGPGGPRFLGLTRGRRRAGRLRRLVRPMSAPSRRPAVTCSPNSGRCSAVWRTSSSPSPRPEPHSLLEVLRHDCSSCFSCPCPRASRYAPDRSVTARVGRPGGAQVAVHPVRAGGSRVPRSSWRRLRWRSRPERRANTSTTCSARWSSPACSPRWCSSRWACCRRRGSGATAPSRRRSCSSRGAGG